MWSDVKNENHRMAADHSPPSLKPSPHYSPRTDHFSQKLLSSCSNCFPRLPRTFLHRLPAARWFLVPREERLVIRLLLPRTRVGTRQAPLRPPHHHSTHTSWTGIPPPSCRLPHFYQVLATKSRHRQTRKIWVPESILSFCEGGPTRSERAPVLSISTSPRMLQMATAVNTRLGRTIRRRKCVLPTPDPVSNAAFSSAPHPPPPPHPSPPHPLNPTLFLPMCYQGLQGAFLTFEWVSRRGSERHLRRILPPLLHPSPRPSLAPATLSTGHSSTPSP